MPAYNFRSCLSLNRVILCQCHPQIGLKVYEVYFRIRYYTLRLAKSDVFTPKLWEAKWIVDEVTCK